MDENGKSKAVLGLKRVTWEQICGHGLAFVRTKNLADGRSVYEPRGGGEVIDTMRMLWEIFNQIICTGGSSREGRQVIDAFWNEVWRQINSEEKKPYRLYVVLSPDYEWCEEIHIVWEDRSSAQ